MPINNLRHRYCRKGKSVCERWRDSFENFIDDMGERPDGCSLDRIKSDENYNPDNCRWSNKFTQAQNRRTVIWIEHEGQRLCASEWSRVTGIPRQTILQRHRKGWLPSQVLKRSCSERITI